MVDVNRVAETDFGRAESEGTSGLAHFAAAHGARAAKIVLALALAVAAFFGSTAYFQTDEAEQARGQLSLYTRSLTAEIERFSHLPSVLALDPFVIRAAQGADRDVLNARLAVVANNAGLDAIYLMDRGGNTVAASNFNLPTSFLGQNYNFRPYFQVALAGQQGTFFGIGATTSLPGYFIANPVMGPTGDVAGVIAIKINLGVLEQSWSESGAHVLVADENGVVVLTSAPEWRYQLLTPLQDDQRQAITQTRQFGDEPLSLLDWSIEGNSRARLADMTFIHLADETLPHGWTLHLFTDLRPAIVKSWLTVLILGAAAGVTFIILQAQKTRRIGRALVASEAEEAALREVNTKLAREIEDRRLAESRLRDAQDELARTSRLASLGRLAASVTHELGQPLAAMRNHLMIEEVAPKPDNGARLANRVGELVNRMENVTRQLKIFSGPGSEEMTEVDLRDAVQGALSLVQDSMAIGSVTIDLRLPEEPVLVRGIKLRIEQVVINLIRNALQAMEETGGTDLTIHVFRQDDAIVLQVLDSGPGLRGATLGDLQEPFVSQRAGGGGMGLGLAISAEIVKEHGGSLSAKDEENGGACFEVLLPRGGGSVS